MTWQKGESGNPEGKAKNKPITDALRCLLSRDPEELLNCKDKPKTVAQKIALDMVQDAINNGARFLDV